MPVREESRPRGFFTRGCCAARLPHPRRTWGSSLHTAIWPACCRALSGEVGGSFFFMNTNDQVGVRSLSPRHCPGGWGQLSMRTDGDQPSPGLGALQGQSCQCERSAWASTPTLGTPWTSVGTPQLAVSQHRTGSAEPCRGREGTRTWVQAEGASGGRGWATCIPRTRNIPPTVDF